MTLGERIAYYRGKLGLSQGELAEKLSVSRQAVSKWETDAGLPDLERLIALSKLFDVTLDELVKGTAEEAPAPTEEAPPEAPAAPSPNPTRSSTQRTVGYILLGCGILCAALSLVLSLALLIPAAYLLLCAVLCLTLRRYAGRVIAGGTLLLVLLPAGRWIGGFSLGGVLSPPLYQMGYPTNVWLIISWAAWAVLVLYVVLALRHTRWQRHTLLVLGWVVVLGLRGWLMPLWRVLGGAAAESWYYPAVSALINLLALAVLFFTARAIARGRKKP